MSGFPLHQHWSNNNPQAPKPPPSTPPIPSGAPSCSASTSQLHTSCSGSEEGWMERAETFNFHFLYFPFIKLSSRGKKITLQRLICKMLFTLTRVNPLFISVSGGIHFLGQSWIWSCSLMCEVIDLRKTSLIKKKKIQHYLPFSTFREFAWGCSYIFFLSQRETSYESLVPRI